MVGCVLGHPRGVARRLIKALERDDCVVFFVVVRLVFLFFL